MIDIATRFIQEKPTDARTPLLRQYLESRDYAHLSQTLGVKAIQISEWDDQRSSTFVKSPTQFIQTWNVPGYAEEIAATAEFSWGTHEISSPFSHPQFKGQQPGENSFIIAGQPAERTWTRSCIPGKGNFVGMTTHHDETVTIADYLSVRDPQSNQLLYQPTIYFTYRSSSIALDSSKEFAANQYVLEPTVEQKIIFDEITEGADSLGVFLLGHDFKGWWIGSLLDIHQTRKVYEKQPSKIRVNSTSLQVAASVVSLVSWMVENPHTGVHFAETIDSEEIVKRAKPFLGTFVSVPVDWQPVEGNTESVWQFSNFVSKGDGYLNEF